LRFIVGAEKNKLSATASTNRRHSQLLAP